MSKIILKILLLAVCFVFFLPSCASLKGKKSSAEITQLSPAEEQLFFYYYYEAVRLRSNQQLDQALETFLLCYNIAPNKAGLNADLGMMYAILGFLDESEKHLRKAVNLQPQNWWYSLRLINLLADRRKFDDAIKTTLALQKHHPYNEDVYFMLASLYTQTRQFDKAIDAYNQMERIVGASEALSVEKLRLYFQAGRPKDAMNEIYRLIEKFPAQTRYQVLLGDIYMEQGDSERALEIFHQVLADDPQNPFVYISLSEYYNSIDEPEKALELIVSALQNTQLDIDTKMEILGKYIVNLLEDDKKIDEIEDLLKLLIEYYPLEEQVHAYYAVFLQFQEREEDMAAVLETITYINPQNEAAWFQLAQPYFADKNYEKVVEIMRRAIENNPETPEFYFYKSIAQLLLKNYEDALETNLSGLKLFGNKQADNRTALQSDFYGQLGDIYHNLEQQEKAFEAYEQAIKFNPNNVHALNNYAYFLAVARENLRHAERMSAKTVELEPRNSTFLDTYAWIFFQQGNYKLAKFYIERAIDNLKKDEENGVIFDHYGDILYRTGDKEKALEMWKRALKEGLDCDDLRRKIETGSLD
jgi:tetratricopeptide (TPR) repeat protein